MNRSFNLLNGTFVETHPPLSPNEAVVEATRCLYCYDAPCTRACPTHIDIPRFIRQILHRDPIGAARTIYDANIFGGSCARVCPTEVLCEGACVDNTMLKEPVRIGLLQRHACDSAEGVSSDFYQAGPPTGKSVAIIGAGPAGLTCAHELRKFGHEVVVFEARDIAGGLNTLGIAGYKQNTDFALSEVDRILQIGIDLRLNHPIDGPKLKTLLDDFDAVFLAIGLGKTAPLKIPGENLMGVWESLDFVFQTHTKPLTECANGQRVIVIGGGNTALDAARAAIRLGASNVTIAYRRDPASMPAFKHELDAAIAEGIDIEWNAMPLSIIEQNGRATGVRFIRTRLEGQGRHAKLAPIEGSEFTLEADMVIKSLGQEPLTAFLNSVPELKLTANYRILVDPTTCATSVPKLFAGGDAMSGAKEEVVNAVQSGKIAAQGIHRALS